MGPLRAAVGVCNVVRPPWQRVRQFLGNQTRIPMSSCSPTSGYGPEGAESGGSNSYLCTCVHSRIIHGSQTQRGPISRG